MLDRSSREVCELCNEIARVKVSLVVWWTNVDKFDMNGFNNC